MKVFAAAVLALALLTPGGAAEAQRTPGWIGIGFEVRSADAAGSGFASAVVTEVREGSPAAGAGIEVGDRLITINGVSTVEEFGNLGERLALRVGDRVQIRVERDGRRFELSLRAAERPSDFGLLTPRSALPTDSMAEEMFRAMDSLRIQILATRPAPAAAPRTPRTRLVVEPAVTPEPPEPVDAPFEFFIFRGERSDSLRVELEALNRRIEGLREQEQQLTAGRRARGVDARAFEAQLAELRDAIATVTRESSALRAAMAEAARASAAIEYFSPAPPDQPPAPEATFRPLTPYLLGSNRVAGAEVVDLRPGLADYFRVDSGVLVVDVAAGTPAAIAGIQPGDVIVNLDRVAIRSVDALRTGISRAGDTLPITLVRQGSRLEVLLRRR
jgi:membrane-associated protease RseP (regulator of RpoE activity)